MPVRCGATMADVRRCRAARRPGRPGRAAPLGAVRPAASRARPARPHPAAGRRRRCQHRDRPAGRRLPSDRDRLPPPVCPPRAGGAPRPAATGQAADGPSAPPGRDPSIHPQPATGQAGITHWSTRLLARELGISRDSIARIWREYGIQPWRAETFKFSTDPELAAKVHDVIGLYLHPPKRAVVLCVDEKAQIQAWSAPNPCAASGLTGPSGAPTTIAAMAPPPCSPRWRSRLGASSTDALPATATRSSSGSSSRSPAPTTPAAAPGL
jgi:hypothetical protein